MELIIQTLLWILAAIAAVYLLFIFGPAVVLCRCVFTGHKKTRMDVACTNHPSYVAHADRMDAACAFLQTLNHETLNLTASDKASLESVFYNRDSEKTAVFLHGYNASPFNNFCLQAKLLYQNRFNLLLIHQRAYGNSDGPTTMGPKEKDDLLEWLEFLKKKTGTKQVLVYGMSMGCTVVAYAAEYLDPGFVKAMVLDCGYASPYVELIREMRVRHLPVKLLWPLVSCYTSLFLKADLKKPVSESLQKTKVPALFFHGGCDRTVPVEEGKENYRACASEKVWFSVPDAGHTLCYPVGKEDAERHLLQLVHKYFS